MDGHTPGLNWQRILRSLRVSGPTARIDLGVMNDLSPASITAVTSELAEANLIVELADTNAPQKRGRPKVLMDLNPTSACVVGVKLSLNHIQFVLADFKGHMVDQDELLIDTLRATPEQLVALIVGGVRSFVAPHKEIYGRMLSVGVAFQGVSAPDNSSIIWSPAAALSGFNLGRALSDALGVPVDVINDANCVALALKYNPAYQNVRNFGVVFIGYGVGLGLIVNGELHRGHFGTASEFGHTKYTLDGPRCSCGKQGCLEAYISDYALYRQMTGVEVAAPEEAEMRALTEHARSNPANREIFENAGRILGFGICNLLALFSPEKLILTGEGTRAIHLLQPAMDATLKAALVDELRAGTKIEVLPWQEDTILRGMVNLSLEHIG